MTKDSSVKPANPRILTINGGSSRIKFALYQVDETPKRRLYGKIDSIGLNGANLTFGDPTGNQQNSRGLAASNCKSAANFLIDWLEGQTSVESVRVVGHRVFHSTIHAARRLLPVVRDGAVPLLISEIGKVARHTRGQR
jgi:acetate kinase